MSFFAVTSQIRGYVDPRDGSPLNGTLRFGVAGQDPEASTVQVFWDSAGTQPAPQPITVRNGFAIRGRTPANLFANSDFSAIARDTRGRLVYSVANSPDFQALGTVLASAVSVADAGGLFTGTDVEAVLQEVGVSLASLATGNLPTGATLDYCGVTPPTGFIMGSGQTIGNASSGALGATHQRANADTSALFTLLWNSSTNSELPIQDSAGAATTRGASAAIDFGLNKRLPTPDCRGRVRAGKDNMGTAATAGRLTAATLLGTTQFNANALTETHALTTAQLATHLHTIAHTHSLSAHTHTIAHTHDMSHTHTILHSNTAGSFPSLALTDGASGNVNVGSMNVTSTGGSSSASSGSPSSDVSGASSAANSGNEGSGTAHNNVQPTVIFSVIIKL